MGARVSQAKYRTVAVALAAKIPRNLGGAPSRALAGVFAEAGGGGQGRPGWGSSRAQVGVGQAWPRGRGRGLFALG